MGRPFGEDLALLGGFGFNTAALFSILGPLSQRLWQGPGSEMLLLSIGLAFAWMIFCEWAYQHRSIRKQNFELKFLAIIHFAPTMFIVLGSALLVLGILLFR